MSHDTIHVYTEYTPHFGGTMAHAPYTAVWLTEPSAAAIEIAKIAGYDTIVLDVEHGPYSLHALDWMLPLINANDMTSIVKVTGPNREAIQQALDLGADAVAIPHIESTDHARTITAYAKFPPLGQRSFAGGRTSSYVGFTNDWVTDQDTNTKCYAMIEDATAFDEIDDILALGTVDGVFIGPSDLSMSRGHGAYAPQGQALDDVATIAQAANNANKPWILPAWSEQEKKLAVQHGAHTIIATMHFGALLSGFQQAAQQTTDIINANNN